MVALAGVGAGDNKLGVVQKRICSATLPYKTHVR